MQKQCMSVYVYAPGSIDPPPTPALFKATFTIHIYTTLILSNTVENNLAYKNTYLSLN